MAVKQDEGININHWSPERGTPDGLYDSAGVVPKIAGFDQVDDAAAQQFHELGFIAIEPAFTPQETQDAIDGLMDCVAGRKKGFDLNVEGGVKDWDKIKRPDARLRRVRKLNQFVDSDERLHHLCYHPALTGLLERLMGEPPKMYANQALLKPPRIGSEKPWHQDMAYFKFGPETMVMPGSRWTRRHRRTAACIWSPAPTATGRRRTSGSATGSSATATSTYPTASRRRCTPAAC